MDTNIFTIAVVGLLTLNTLIIILMFKAMVILLQDIRAGSESTIGWLREIAGHSLTENEEEI